MPSKSAVRRSIGLVRRMAGPEVIGPFFGQSRPGSTQSPCRKQRARSTTTSRYSCKPPRFVVSARDFAVSTPHRSRKFAPDFDALERIVECCRIATEPACGSDRPRGLDGADLRQKAVTDSKTIRGWRRLLSLSRASSAFKMSTRCASASLWPLESSKSACNGPITTFRERRRLVATKANLYARLSAQRAPS
jgi:hypothetical protein